MRFEYFLTLLKNASFIVGNSSAGIREAPYYGVPTINIGTRQQNRSLHEHIVNVNYDSNKIIKAMLQIERGIPEDMASYGEGNSSDLFMSTLEEGSIWNINHQKLFRDY